LNVLARPLERQQATFHEALSRFYEMFRVHRSEA
jgi:hypothetical protein